MSSKEIRKKIESYEKILFIRKIEENISKRYKEQNMRCPVHLSVGQEATAVGVCNHLTKKDIVFSGHRSHAHYLAKGCDPQKMLDEIHGKSTGCIQGKGGSMHLQDLDNNFYASIPIVGSSLGLAVGTALNQKRKNKTGISVVFFGDGAVEEGIFHEALNMASIFELPILFVCENNYYSIFTHIKDRQPSANMTRFAKAHHIKSLRTNGYDLNNVDKKSKYAISEIKKNRKPFFIQFDNYRFLEHCGPNDDDYKNYRPISEQKLWKSKDPVKLLSNELVRKKLLNKKQLLNIEEKIQVNIDKMFKRSISAPLPKPSEAKNHLYA